MEGLKEKLNEFNQSQLLQFVDELEEDKKESLIYQIENIDFDYMKSLYDSKDFFEMDNKEISPLEVVIKEKLNISGYEKRGARLIQEGKLAICSMAGGQGTRLGYDGPKGTYMLELDKPTSIFETTINKLKYAKEKYGVLVYWYIMTSNQNHEDTVKFFEDNQYFGYDKSHIIFFKQGELPLLDMDGKIVLKDKGHIFMAPDGNGGIFRALGKEGIISHMKEHDIQYLAVGNVDNILIHMVDPIVVALMEERKLEMVSKSFMKPSPEGKWGVFCKMDGKPSVIEYIETPKELLEARNEEGELIFGDAHFGCNFFNIELLERIVDEKLPMHAACKKNKVVNSNGEILEADTYKFEAFIFDAFAKAQSIVVFRVKREDEFAPIKNKDGEESPKTAIKLYQDFYNRRIAINLKN